MLKLETVLFVEDDLTTSRFQKFLALQSGLAKEVLAIEEARGALHFIQQLCGRRERIPEVIFVDCQMPVMDGWEFVANLESLQPNFINQPVVVMLSSEEPERFESELERHKIVHSFIRKPLTPEKFERITSLFSMKKRV